MIASDQTRLALLERFAAAWNAHDVDALMACMADECEFMASAGPEFNGAWHRGRDAVRKAYAAVFEAFPEAQWMGPRHLVCGDRGVSEWRFIGHDRNGKSVDVTGCDLFTFDGDRIRIKNSYRKDRT